MNNFLWGPVLLYKFFDQGVIVAPRLRIDGIKGITHPAKISPNFYADDILTLLSQSLYDLISLTAVIEKHQPR